MCPVDQTETRVVALPTWLVSTPHAYVRRLGPKHGVTLPYGVQHARQVGGPLTACGLWAIGWELFWETAFPGDSSSSCSDCLRAVAQTESDSRG